MKRKLYLLFLLIIILIPYRANAECESKQVMTKYKFCFKTSPDKCFETTINFPDEELYQYNVTEIKYCADSDYVLNGNLCIPSNCTDSIVASDNNVTVELKNESGVCNSNANLDKEFKLSAKVGEYSSCTGKIDLVCNATVKINSNYNFYFKDYQSGKPIKSLIDSSKKNQYAIGTGTTFEVLYGSNLSYSVEYDQEEVSYIVAQWDVCESCDSGGNTPDPTPDKPKPDKPPVDTTPPAIIIDPPAIIGPPIVDVEIDANLGSDDGTFWDEVRFYWGRLVGTIREAANQVSNFFGNLFGLNKKDNNGGTTSPEDFGKNQGGSSSNNGLNHSKPSDPAPPHRDSSNDVGEARKEQQEIRRNNNNKGNTKKCSTTSNNVKASQMGCSNYACCKYVETRTVKCSDVMNISVEAITASDSSIKTKTVDATSPTAKGNEKQDLGTFIDSGTTTDNANKKANQSFKFNLPDSFINIKTGQVLYKGVNYNGQSTNDWKQITSGYYIPLNAVPEQNNYVNAKINGIAYAIKVNGNIYGTISVSGDLGCPFGTKISGCPYQDCGDATCNPSKDKYKCCRNTNYLKAHPDYYSKECGNIDDYIYRSISLIDPFPNRDAGENWYNWINNQENKTRLIDSYNGNVNYTMDLSNNIISKIRDYNKIESNKYTSWSEMNDDGSSSFLKEGTGHSISIGNDFVSNSNYYSLGCGPSNVDTYDWCK